VSVASKGRAHREARSRRGGNVVGAVLALLSVGAVEGCSGDSRPAKWGYIAPIILEPNCATASCHSRAAAAAGLDFSDADRGYKSLTGLWVWVPNPTATDKQTLNCGTSDKGVPVCEEHFRPLVTPFVPSESRLVNVLRARGAERMPPDRPLDEADIRLVEQWILDGAKRDDHQTFPDAATHAPAPDGTGPDGGAASDAFADDGPGSDGDGASGDLGSDGTGAGG
jgi:hypothetical protein